MEKYENGPDQIILEASELFVSSPHESVKIRNFDLEAQPEVVSVPTLLKSKAAEFPDDVVSCKDSAIFTTHS